MPWVEETFHTLFYNIFNKIMITSNLNLFHGWNENWVGLKTNGTLYCTSSPCELSNCSTIQVYTGATVCKLCKFFNVQVASSHSICNIACNILYIHDIINITECCNQWYSVTNMIWLQVILWNIVSCELSTSMRWTIIFLKHFLLQCISVLRSTGQITSYLSVSLHLCQWRIGKYFTRGWKT